MFRIVRFFKNASLAKLHIKKVLTKDYIAMQFSFVNNVLEENPASAESIRAELYKRNIPVLNASSLSMDYDQELKKVVQYMVDESNIDSKKFSDIDLKMSFKISSEAGDLKISEQIYKFIENRESKCITEGKKINLLNPPKAIWAVGIGSLIKSLKKVKKASLLPERQIFKVKYLIGSRTSKFFARKSQLFGEIFKNNSNVEKISDKKADM
jgi:hypothetical protein